MADYYLALPILSYSLNGALFNSDSLIDELEESGPRILPTAAKLRNSLLFRECLVLATSLSNEKKISSSIEDPKLLKVVLNAYRRVASKVLELQHSITSAAVYSRLGCQDTSLSDAIDIASEETYDRYREEVALPHYFRTLWKVGLFEDLDDQFKEILRNKLVLVRIVPDEEGLYSGQFLCAEIDDEDLPWDIKETQW